MIILKYFRFSEYTSSQSCLFLWDNAKIFICISRISLRVNLSSLSRITNFNWKYSVHPSMVFLPSKMYFLDETYAIWGVVQIDKGKWSRVALGTKLSLGLNWKRSNMLVDGLFISGKAGAIKSTVCSLALQRNALPRALNIILRYVF